MNLHRPVGRAGQAVLTFAVSAWLTITLLMIIGAIEAQQRSAQALEQAARATVNGQLVHVAGIKQDLWVPSWQRLEANGRWAYVSGQQGIAIDWQPQLEPVSVAVADWVDDKRLHPQAHQQARVLMAAATQAGHPLIITSAYRSAQQQQRLIDDTIKQRGQQYASDYIAKPGHSEHQLGLAVDFSSYSLDCQRTFERCVLQPAAATWLAAHAPEHGFILRYPAGKATITGVRAETWHFRYVGRELAHLVQTSGLTFDEVYQQLAAQKEQASPSEAVNE